MPVALCWLLTLLLSLAHADAVEDIEQLLRADRTGAAMEQLQDHLEARPDDTAAHELFIDILLSAGLFDAATQRYRTYAGDNPASADAWYLLGRALLEPEEAARALQRALEIDPDHARAHMGRAALSRATGDLAAAQRDYQRAVDLDPSLAEAWVGLWSTQHGQGDLKTAAVTAQRATEAIPNEPEPWLVLAGLQPDRARAHYEAGLSRCPGEARLTVGYARQTFLDRDLEAALKAYVAAQKAAPDDPALRVEAAMLAEIAEQRLTWEGATALIDVRSAGASAETNRRLDGVVSQHPRSVLARVVRGNVRQIEGDVEGARADLEAAVEMDPGSSAARAALGLLLLSAREPAAAIPHLQAATAARPRDVALGIAAAVALSEGQDPGAGGIALLELQERFPHSAGPPMALAQLLMKLGEPDRAYTILAGAIENNPEPQLMLALAAAAEAAGRPEEAAQVLEMLGERTGDPRFAQAARQLLGGSSP